MTRIKRSFVLLMVTMALGATYGGGCSLLGPQVDQVKTLRAL